MSLYLLFESCIGYGLFQIKKFDEINTNVKKVQNDVKDFQVFSQIVHLKAFYPFESSNIALQIINTTLNGKAPEQLITFLNENLPLQKKSKIKLGVNDNKLAGAINENIGIKTITSRIRQYIVEYLRPQNENIDIQQSRLGLAHSYSRNRITFDVNRQDKSIIQSINLIQLLDKDINNFTMKIKQWYSWHYPQLIKIVTDPFIYVQLVYSIADKNHTLINQSQIQDICGNADITTKIIQSMKNSMGQQISQFDITCLQQLCQKTLKMFQYRKQMQQYLKNRMEIVSPNLTTLLGQGIAAKLIAHSGSLSTLAKYPASTIQILGAQKALFRALKQKTKTPKYGLLYNTSYIGRAIGKKKGKISRYLANKCAIAARLDHFLIKPTNKFGERLKQQIEKKLQDDDDQYDNNEDIMDEIISQLKQQKMYFDSQDKYNKSLKKKKIKKFQIIEEESQNKPKKKKKKISK